MRIGALLLRSPCLRRVGGRVHWTPRSLASSLAGRPSGPARPNHQRSTHPADAGLAAEDVEPTMMHSECLDREKSRQLAGVFRDVLQSGGVHMAPLRPGADTPLADSLRSQLACIHPDDLSAGDLYLAMGLLPHQYALRQHAWLSKRLVPGMCEQGGPHLSADVTGNLGAALFDRLEEKLSRKGADHAAAPAGRRGVPWAEVAGALSGLSWLRGRREGLSDRVLQHVTALVLSRCAEPQVLPPGELGHVLSVIYHRLGMVSCDRTSTVLALLRALHLAAHRDCEIVCSIEDGAVPVTGPMIDSPSMRGTRHQDLQRRAVRYSASSVSAALMGLQHLTAESEEVSALLLHLGDAIRHLTAAVGGDPSSSKCHFGGTDVIGCLIGMRLMRSNDVSYSGASREASSTDRLRDRDRRGAGGKLCPSHLVGGAAVRRLLEALAGAIAVAPVLDVSPRLVPAAPGAAAPPGMLVISPMQDHVPLNVLDGAPDEANPPQALYTFRQLCFAVQHCRGFSDGYGEVRQLLHALADKMSLLDRFCEDGRIAPIPRPTAAEVCNAIFGLQSCHYSFTYTYPTVKLVAALTRELERCHVAISSGSETGQAIRLPSSRDISQGFYGLKKMERKNEDIMRIVSLLRQMLCSGSFSGTFNKVDIGMVAEGLRFLPSHSEDVRAVLSFLAGAVRSCPASFSGREATSCLFALQNMDYMSPELCSFIAAVTDAIRDDSLKFSASECAMSLLSLRLKSLQEPCILDLINVLTQKIAACDPSDTFSRFDTVDLQTVLKDLRERHHWLSARARAAGSLPADERGEHCEAAVGSMDSLRAVLLQKVKREAQEAARIPTQNKLYHSHNNKQSF